METIDELTTFLRSATAGSVRGRLLARGEARALMRERGALPDDAPNFGPTIDTDLAEYGFSLLRAALALREAGGRASDTQPAFERAAKAFESLVRNGPPELPERGIYRVIAAAAYHLAGYSAIAYALFAERDASLNSTPSEDALILLILRDLNGLRNRTRDWLRDDANSDQTVASRLVENEMESDDAVAVILNTTICRALAYFDFSLQTGEAELLETARGLLARSVRLAADAGAVALWWIARLAFNLIGDLWDHSLHANLPIQPPLGGEESYDDMRALFIASLYGRRNAEVELWPSQREAVRRSTDLTDDLVVSLPTSAGKTRVAEIAALMTLSTGRRVLIVTPLRALSAQTERSFRATFAPLGLTVSSLYGASGVSAGDEDALRSRNIVIATPEKLDFALRSDPSLIDDVGLIVLDEGHLIGPTEREIRYEILVQRLLRRPDAETRRIVCLSAILPVGQQLDDLTAWIRRDVEGDPVKSDWRPTRQRFGTLIWRGQSARLTFDLSNNVPYLAHFVEQVAPHGRQKKPLPRHGKDLTLFAAWKLAAQGKRTLIFCTQANWVEGYGTRAIELVQQGYLQALIPDEVGIQRALEVGREWLGEDHPAVAALRLGVAIHHGRLPNPFLREVECLLATGALKVIVASPTLSQGLNLNAAILLVPSLYRSGEIISAEEFANVAGRAGRAFVDVEGLVVHVMFESNEWRFRKWRGLVASARARSLESGLIQIVAQVIDRLAQRGILSRGDAFEYLANAREAWQSTEDKPADQDEHEGSADSSEPLAQLVEKLDATVLGLVEALDGDSADLPRLLDEALKGSLWARQIARTPEDNQVLHRAILEARARLIWMHTTPAARKGHFAMGVGLEAGLALDAMAGDLAELVDRADLASIQGNEGDLSNSLIGLAERLFVVRPFVPGKALPTDWREILRLWVSGTDAETIGADKMAVVEEAFSYRLVWALEALRTRRAMLGWSPDFVAGGGAASLETGVPHFTMSMLIRAGLPSRMAAMVAVRESGASFLDGTEMRAWLESNEIIAFTDAGDWPTPKTAELWKRFREEVLSSTLQRWTEQHSTLDLAEGVERPSAGIYRLEVNHRGGQAWICTPDHQRLAPLRCRVRDPKPSLFAVRFVGDEHRAFVQRFGRDRATWSGE